MMNGGPELGSVAPPARIPPKFSVATQMRAKVTIPTARAILVNRVGR